MKISSVALVLALSATSIAAQSCPTTRNNDYGCATLDGQCCGVLTNCGTTKATYSNYCYVPPSSLTAGSGYSYTAVGASTSQSCT